ncbi:AAA family ATPase [Actinomadura graeca]|uniref:AAA family ATPase n=1 Tax=Actinomadura graeca TaxID=2750812 RepID=A0ABX8QMR1_9ACTN|nr:AAA family ATPase [Actinomadura graeca]QXJ19646.1 AAA family ATPase [Actinomadura graeca]
MGVLIAPPPQPTRRGFAEQVLTLDELRALPGPEPLIEDTIDRRTVTVLAGPWASGKSFLALDWSLCIASGKPWQGRPVQHTGTVLYIAAEGAYGLAARMEAWSAAWRCALPEGLLVFPKPVNLTNSVAVAEVIAYVWEHRVTLVVIDTLARCMSGADENSSRDMGIAIEALYAVRHATAEESGAVLAVHHTGKDRTTVRGSSALEAGADSVWQVEASTESAQFKLGRTKRKDGPRGLPLSLKLSERSGSCIVEHSHGGMGMTGSEEVIQSHFNSHFSEYGPVAVSLLRTVTGLPETTFYRALNSLASKGLVRLEKDGRGRVAQWIGGRSP